MLVSETFGDNDYDVIIKSVFDFRFKLIDFKKQMEVSKLKEEVCLKKLDSNLYKTNNCNGTDSEDCQNMCDFISKIYGKQIYNYP